MSDRHIPRAELQAARELDVTIGKLLPGIIKQLPQNVMQWVTDEVYRLIGSPAGKVPLEVILQKKYVLLLEGGHIAPFTPEQIEEANRKTEKETIESPESPVPGDGADESGMIV